MKPIHRIASTLLAGAAALMATSAAVATPYDQTDLISDVTGLALITDPNLHNPWGMSFSATSPFWVSEQGTSNATLYRFAGGVVSQVVVNGSPDVAIPTTAAGPQGPTAPCLACLWHSCSPISR